MSYLINGKSVLTAAVVAISCFAIVPASAQTAIAKKAVAKAEAVIGKVKAACATEMQSFCSTVTPGEGRLVLCMIAHEDKLGDKCFETFVDAAQGLTLSMSNIGRALEVCDSDIRKHCGKIQEGQGRVAQCLVDKKAKLTSACRGEVASFEARIKK